MKVIIPKLFCFTLLGVTLACQNNQQKSASQSDATEPSDSLVNQQEYGASITPPEPSSPTDKFAKIVGWKEDKKPKPAAGFKAVKFAGDLNSPRRVYVAPNGDIFVAQSRTERPEDEDKKIDSRNIFRSKSPNEILRFKDVDGDGIPESQEVFLSGLSQPYGMLVLGNYFYVANTDALVRFPYNVNTGEVENTPEKLLDLPAGGYNNHWTRNIVSNEEGTKIYIAVGSGSNVGENGMEHEERRAAILEVDPDGKNERLFASGLRNPVGLDWEPVSGKLWTAVNERDELGDELVPDYITSVQEGGFYGWPYTYWGETVDPRWEGKTPGTLVAQSMTPDYAVGSHTASLGVAFSPLDSFRKGAYISQHGSWNRSEFSGYKILFVPFENGKPSGEPADFLTGFISNEDGNEVYGRPVDVTFTDSYLLTTEDAANTIWAIIPE